MSIRTGWLRHPAFDIVMAWGWLPFYLWLLSTPLAGDVHAAAYKPAFKTAVAAALSITFIHRHFVYFLFFGDPKQRQQHPRSLWLFPLLVIAIVASAKLIPMAALWTVIMVVVGAWNIWHTLMQRHGLARAYAVKAGGGLETQAHGKKDQALLFSSTLFMAAIVLAFRQDTFWGQAAKVFGYISAINDHPVLRYGVVVITGVLWAMCMRSWLVAEQQATPTSRTPRLVWLASTVMILATFIISGPIIGYITFGVAHSIEYILFVFMMANRRASNGDTSIAAVALGKPMVFTITSAMLLVSFVAARQVWTIPIFIVYYLSTSIMHFYYDGIIWKLRRPELRAQLG